MKIPERVKDIISRRNDPVIAEYFRVMQLHPSRIALVGLAEIGFQRMGL